eukprot:1196273-Prorocentrum_minimum.AAC.5
MATPAMRVGRFAGRRCEKFRFNMLHRVLPTRTTRAPGPLRGSLFAGVEESVFLLWAPRVCLQVNYSKHQYRAFIICLEGKGYFLYGAVARVHASPLLGELLLLPGGVPRAAWSNRRVIEAELRSSWSSAGSSAGSSGPAAALLLGSPSLRNVRLYQMASRRRNECPRVTSSALSTAAWSSPAPSSTSRATELAGDEKSPWSLRYIVRWSLVPIWELSSACSGTWPTSLVATPMCPGTVGSSYSCSVGLATIAP